MSNETKKIKSDKFKNKKYFFLHLSKIATGIYNMKCVLFLNKMYDYRYERLKGCSCSWSKYLICAWQFIIDLKTIPTAVA